MSIECYDGDSVMPKWMEDERKQTLARMVRRLKDHKNAQDTFLAERYENLRVNRDGYESTYVLGCERHDFIDWDREEKRVGVDAKQAWCNDWYSHRLHSIGTLIVRTPDARHDKPMRRPIWNAFLGVTIIERFHQPATQFAEEFEGCDTRHIVLDLVYREHIGGRDAQALMPYRDNDWDRRDPSDLPDYSDFLGGPVSRYINADSPTL